MRRSARSASAVRRRSGPRDFQKKLGIEFQFVPYRGAAAIVQDLIAGQIDLGCVEASNVVAHLKRRQDQVLCRAVGGPLGGRARHSDHR